MDSLDRAKKHLKKKYKKVKRIWDCVEIGSVIEVYEVDEKELKLCILVNEIEKTIIYDLKIEDVIE